MKCRVCNGEFDTVAELSNHPHPAPAPDPIGKRPMHRGEGWHCVCFQQPYYELRAENERLRAERDEAVRRRWLDNEADRAENVTLRARLERIAAAAREAIESFYSARAGEAIDALAKALDGGE